MEHDDILLALLTAAEKDIQSAKVLLKKQIYSNAAFNFQQAVEKACKFWGLSQGLITGDELQKIGHKSEKIFKRIFQDMDKFCRNATKEFDRMATDIKNIQELNERVKRVCSNLYNITSQQIIPIEEKQTRLEALEKFYCSPTVPEIFRLNKLFKRLKTLDNTEVMAERFIEDTESFCKTPACLMQLSLLVFDTEQNTRYPEINKNRSPDKLYIAESVYIQQLPFLLDLLTFCCYNLRRFYPIQN